MLHGTCVYCHRKKDEQNGFCIVTGQQVDCFSETSCQYHNKKMPSDYKFYEEGMDKVNNTEEPKRKTARRRKKADSE